MFDEIIRFYLFLSRYSGLGRGMAGPFPPAISKSIAMLFASFALLSCMKEERPEDVLNPRQMQEILLDIQVADAYSESAYGIYKDKKLLLEELFQGVLDHHGVSRKKFYDSYGYYIIRPRILDSIYDNVFYELDSLVNNYEH